MEPRDERIEMMQDTTASTPQSKPSRPRKPLLLATDGSTGADHAADFAAELAEALGARVIVAAVAAAHGYLMFPWDSTKEEQPIPTSVAAAWAYSDAERLRSQGLDVTEVVLEGHPADALIAEAGRDSVSVMVVGRHGATHTGSPLPGSVVEKLASRCPCPLVVVP
jgi:nucleotide-binding universal stress UspA family protein